MTVDCTAPGKVSEIDIIAYLDGEAAAPVVEHVVHCAYCQGVAAEFSQIDRFIAQHYYRFHCPEFDQIWRYVHGETIDRSDRKHIEQCGRCQLEVKLLRDATF